MSTSFVLHQTWPTTPRCKIQRHPSLRTNHRSQGEQRTHQKVHYRHHHLARGSPHITNRKSNPLLHYFRKSLRHQPETKDRRYENRSLSIEYLSLRKSFTLHSAYSLHFTKKKKINKGTKTISIIITINTKEKIFLNNATKPEQPKYQTNLKRV